MKFFFIFLTLLFFTYISNAQKKCKTLEAKAFISISMPGNIPVDENGNPFLVKENIIRTIYLTTSCQLPPVLLTIKYYNLEGIKISNGVTLKNVIALKVIVDKSIAIKKIKGSTTWRLDIDLGENKIEQNNTLRIQINGTLGKEKFDLKLKSETKLESVPTY